MGQLFKITHELNKYIWEQLKPKKTHNLSRATIDKQVGSSVPKVWTTTIAIVDHMAIIQV